MPETSINSMQLLTPLLSKEVTRTHVGKNVSALKEAVPFGQRTEPGLEILQGKRQEYKYPDLTSLSLIF